MVLAAERDRADGAFDGVIIKFDTAVIEKATKGGPAGECISDRIRNTTAGRESVEFELEPGLHRCDQRQQLATAYALACVGGLASDGRLRIELADASERLGCDG